MIEGNRQQISLASLAISVNALSLLGVSGVVFGAEPQACVQGGGCVMEVDGAGQVGGNCMPEGHVCACVAENPFGGLVMQPSAQCVGGGD